MTKVNIEVLERNLGRALDEPEKAIVEACGPDLQGLAYICIQERVALSAAKKIASYLSLLLHVNAEHAAKLAVDTVKMERLAPGSVSDDDSKKPRH